MADTKGADDGFLMQDIARAVGGDVRRNRGGVHEEGGGLHLANGGVRVTEKLLCLKSILLSLTLQQMEANLFTDCL